MQAAAFNIFLSASDLLAPELESNLLELLCKLLKSTEWLGQDGGCLLSFSSVFLPNQGDLIEIALRV